MTKKKKKIKLGSIYIFINIVFILGCFIFYGYRLIHFYRLEHPKIEENTPLYELITLDKISRPFLTTAAAVSSHELSIPKINVSI